ncbi:MAG: hypothetical protein AB8B60_08975 [Sulfitobacter sp.]
MPLNLKIKQIEEAEKQLVKIVADEAKLRKEYEKDGLDDNEKRDLKRYADKKTNLENLVARLRAEIEENRRIWESRFSDLVAFEEKLDALKDWDDPAAPALQEMRDHLYDALEDQRWADAVIQLDFMLEEIAPAYENYVTQSAAKTEFDALLVEYNVRIETVADGTLGNAQLIAEVDALREKVAGIEQEVLTSKDYVTALEALKDIEFDLAYSEAGIVGLARRQEEFEQQWQRLQGPLQNVFSIEAPSLGALRDEILQLQAQVQLRASQGEHYEATQMLPDLVEKIDEFMSAYAEIAELQEQYETRLPNIQRDLDEVSAGEFPALAEQQTAILQIADAMKAAADAGDYETALSELDKLPPLLEAFKDARDEARLGQEYDDLYESMKDGLDAVASSNTPPLADLAAEIAADQQTAENHAAAGDYRQAIDTLLIAGPKLQRWADRLGALMEAQAEYNRLLPDVMSRYDALATCEYPQLQEQAQEMVDLRDRMETAANEGDFVVAMECLTALSDLLNQIGQVRDTMDAKRSEYESRLPGLITRFDGLMQSDFAELVEVRQALETTRSEMEAAAQANDFPLAVDKMGAVERQLNNLDAQLGNLIDLRQQYEDMYLEIKRDIATVEGCVHPRLEAKKTPIMALKTEMLQAAEATDFATALEKAKALVPLLVEFIKLEELLQGYLRSLEAVTPKIEQVKGFTYKSMEDMKEEVTELFDAMEADAAEAKIAEAIKKMTDLQKLVADAIARNDELATNEPVYIKLRDDMAEKIVLVRNSEIEEAEEEATKVLDAHEEMIEKEEEDEFILAIEIADKINKKLLPAFLKKVDTAEDQEAAYNLIKEIAMVAYGNAEAKRDEYPDALGDKFDALTEIKEEMTSLEEERNFAGAKVKAQALITAVKSFDAEWVKQSELEAALTATAREQITRFNRLKSDAEARLPNQASEMFETASGYASTLEDAVNDKDVEAMESAIDDLRTELDELEDQLMTASELKAKYEGRHASLQPLYDQANASPHAALLVEELRTLNEAWIAMEAKAASDVEDYNAALDLADDVDTALRAFDTAEMARNTEKVIYEERWAGLEGQYADAMLVDDETLQDKVSEATSMHDDMQAKATASPPNYKDAGDLAKSLRPIVEHILDKAEELEDERAAEDTDGPAGEIGDKVDEVADKGRDLVDKIKDKVGDELLDRAIDALPDPIGHGIEAAREGLDAASNAIDAASHAIDGDFDEAADSMLDAASSAFDAVVEGVQVDPRARPFEKPLDGLKKAKDVIEDIVRD